MIKDTHKSCLMCDTPVEEGTFHDCPARSGGLKDPVASMLEKEVKPNILYEASSIINGDRQDTYGAPEDSFAIIAKFWQAYMETILGGAYKYKLTALDVAHMMSLFKHARMMGQKPSRDNYVDAIGYLAIAADRLTPSKN